ncbi:hypothetical protein CRG98_000150 [Punica granatum]|uniref:Dof zinc finger protein n=1 Tax=Punica granatum TaxID=22663 RepID=A0A2I0LFK4_PUNGR|nr:hypothetical protein CRG98_000150 [Punica granatum]
MQDPSAFLQPVKPQFPEQERLKCPRCESTNTKFCYYNNYNLSQPRHFCKNCRRYWTKGGALRNIPVGGGTRKSAKRPTNAKRPSPGPVETEPRPEGSSQARSPRLIEPSHGLSQPAVPQQSAQGPSPGPSPARIVHPGSGILGLGTDPERRLLDTGGSFSSLLTSNLQFGTLLEGLNPNSSGPKVMQFGVLGENLNSGTSLNPSRGPNGVQGQKSQSNNMPDSDCLSLQNGNGNGNGNGGNGEVAAGGVFL